MNAVTAQLHAIMPLCKSGDCLEFQSCDLVLDLHEMVLSAHHEKTEKFSSL